MPRHVTPRCRDAKIADAAMPRHDIAWHLPDVMAGFSRVYIRLY